MSNFGDKTRAAPIPGRKELDPSFGDVASFIEMADFTGGAGPHLMADMMYHEHDLPRTLEVYLAFLGFREWRPLSSASFDGGTTCHPRSSARRRLAKAYFWTIRVLIVAVCLYTAFSGLIASAFNINKSYLQGIDLRCSESSTFDPSAPPPCLLQVALESTIPVFGVAAGVVYLWLIFAGTSDGSILKSHRIQCTEKVSEYIYKYGAASLLFIVMFPLTYSISVGAKLKKNGIPADQWNSVIMQTILLTTLIGVAVAPFTGLAILVYTETRRLRFVVADSLAVIQAKPIDFFAVSKAYLGTLENFKAAQNHFSQILGFSMISFFAVVCFSIIPTYYINVLGETHYYLLPLILQVLSVMYPLLLIVYSIIAANEAAGNILEECFDILARIPPPSEDPYESLMLLRLTKVIQQRPCEFRVLGYRFEASDPIKILGGVFTAQLLSFFGLSFLFGG